ncbi:MAG: hypothetical protein NC328_07860 [Muribaculum sp.]|nr:hypothetical protein [Muribaculum sp.]
MANFALCLKGYSHLWPFPKFLELLVLRRQIFLSADDSFFERHRFYYLGELRFIGALGNLKELGELRDFIDLSSPNEKMKHV